jgi:hypothetical protein
VAQAAVSARSSITFRPRVASGRASSNHAGESFHGLALTSE